jgi:type IV secretory pathway VirB2 component (pilin)
MQLVSYASDFGSLSTAPGSSVLVAAVSWLEGTLLGTIATTVAIVAVSWVGMLMLAGRVDIRRGLTVVAGCFVIFGAASIVAGLRSFTGGEQLASAPPVPPVAPPPVPQPGPPRSADPYAGASVPRL